jgi:uncharacterized protein (DUF2147 family)
MKHIAILMIFLLSLVTVVAAGGEADTILGVWATDPEDEGGQAHIEIYKEGDRYFGKIVWLSEPLYLEGDPHGPAGEAKIDTENPDEALRSLPIIGMTLMRDFRYNGKGLWQKGTIYDANNGKTYKAKLRLADDGALKVRGYIGFSLIGRTEEWTRVDPQIQ